MRLKDLFGPGFVGAALLLATNLTASARDIQVGDVKITQAETHEGKATATPWSGIWWPLSQTKLSRGWNGTGDDFTYDATAKRWVRSPAQKAQSDLSPLLKYDAYVKAVTGTDPGAALMELTGEGDFQHNVYGDKKAEYDRDGVSYSWWGHCNGWCAAALLEREPVAPVEARGIRFEVADQKGLLTESFYGVESDFTGKRFNAPPAYIKDSRGPDATLLAALNSGSPRPVAEYIAWYEKAWQTTMSATAKAAAKPADFKDELETFDAWYKRTYDEAYADLQPHVFHKILESVIGQRKLGFVCDITANEEVWNHPAFAYTTTSALLRDFNEGNLPRKEWSVTTEVRYATDGVSESMLGIDEFSRTYTYTVVTDAAGVMLRSAWTGDSVDDHPDFAWLPLSNPTGVDTGENPKLLYSRILELLPESHGASSARAFDLSANGVSASTRRAGDRTTTWSQPIASTVDVPLAVTVAAGRALARVAYFEQKVSGSGPAATRDPLVALGESTTAPAFAASARFASNGKKMIVAFAYDAAGKLIGTDEVTVQVGGTAPPANQPDDVYEQNDTRATAAALTAGTFPNMRCQDEDWYKVTLASPGSINVTIDFKNADGDLDLSLEGPSAQVATSDGSGDRETCAGANLPAGTYAVRVHGYNGARAPYTLTLATTGSTSTPPAATDDRYEENDTRAQAAPLPAGSYPGLACNDDDFFKVTLAAPSTLGVKASFRNAEGDLDLQLLAADGAELGKSDTTADAESVTKAGLPAGTYLVRVFGYGGAKAAYSLEVTVTPTGTTPAPTTRAGTITATTLNVRRGPAATFAIATTLPKDAAVTVLEERSGWYRVSFANAPAGELWVSKTYVRLS